MHLHILLGAAATLVASAQSFVVVGCNIQSRSSSSSTTLAATSPSSGRRQPWNVFRFLQQSSKFVSVLPFPRTGTTKVLQPGDVLWETASTNNDFTLAPLDDVVMGGVSSSSFSSSNGKWQGQVTDANNGGFVGIRSTPSFDYDMTKCTGIELIVKNQGSSKKQKKKRFKLGLRDSKEFNGIVWNSSFDVPTGGTCTTIRVPFSKLIPALFARTVKFPAPVFRKDNVVGIQLVHSKFEYDGALNPNFEVGNVDLEIVSIKAY